MTDSNFCPTKLEILNLKKNYGTKAVLKDVSLSLTKGEVVGLLGPNGAGKNYVILYNRRTN